MSFSIGFPLFCACKMMILASLERAGLHSRWQLVNLGKTAVFLTILDFMWGLQNTTYQEVNCYQSSGLEQSKMEMI